MAQEIGDKFGKYEIVGEVGRGAMGIVYKARDPILGRLIALKTLTSELLSDRNLLTRFYREAQSAGSLQHPNIVIIYDLDEVEGRPYIAMEFVEGESLQKIIARRATMPLAHKVKIIAQFCQGLDHAHQHGVIHRDVKPANILVRSDGVVKVVDFGIAHLESTSITTTGMFMGTIDYSAPEQLNESRVDVRSEVFAVGIVAYELLAYRKPFGGANTSSVINEILHKEPVSLRDLAPEVPQELEDLVKKCLQKDPDQRFQSLQDLLLQVQPIEQALEHSWADQMVKRVPELLARKDFSQAREILRSALMLDSSHGQAKALMVEVETAIERQEAAAKARQRVAEGDQSLKQGEYARAVRLLEEAVKLDPRNEQAQSLLEPARKELARTAQLQEGLATGRRAYREGNLTQAEVALRKVLELDQENEHARILLAKISQERAARERRFRLREGVWQATALIEQGKYERAVQQLEALEKEYPEEEEIRQLLEAARAKAEERRREEELKAVQELSKSEGSERRWSAPKRCGASFRMKPNPPGSTILPRPSTSRRSGKKGSRMGGRKSGN